MVIFGFKVKFNQQNLWNNVKITDLPFILRKSKMAFTMEVNWAKIFEDSRNVTLIRYMKSLKSFVKTCTLFEL